jgi:2-C-methyl-D-erythritol 2,4-cyclodiphosphate synthase
MKKVLAGILGIRPDDISIKATTTEKLGFVGREEGLSAYAVVMITL